MPAPTSEIARIAEKYKCHTLVETGTYVGTTALWASTIFKRVISIEADVHLWNMVRQRTREATNTINIDFLYGRSEDILPGVCWIVKDPVVFWLDGHYSGHGTYGKHEINPIVKELQIILDSDLESYIFIDDLRLMDNKEKDCKGNSFWPTVEHLTERLVAGGYKTSILGDILYAEKVQNV